MSDVSDERFRVFFKVKDDGWRFRLRDKTVAGTLAWLTEAEAYQLRDALNDVIDHHEERCLSGQR